MRTQLGLAATLIACACNSVEARYRDVTPVVGRAVGRRRLERADLATLGPVELAGLGNLHRPERMALLLAGLRELEPARPGVTTLRLRHGDTAEWSHGGVDLELALPDLEQLDLALPVNWHIVPAELEGVATALNRLARLRYLHLSPLEPEFAQTILAGPTLDRLQTLELVGVRGPRRVVAACRAAPPSRAGVRDGDERDRRAPRPPFGPIANHRWATRGVGGMLEIRRVRRNPGG